MTNVVLDHELMESIVASDHALLERWLAAEGDRAHAGQVPAHARLLQQTLDITAAQAGVLEEIVGGGGQTFMSGTALARIVAY